MERKPTAEELDHLSAETLATMSNDELQATFEALVDDMIEHLNVLGLAIVGGVRKPQ